MWIRNWFSNMKEFDTPMVYQGMKFYTVENFYQAMKTKDISERRRVASMDPFAAKKYGKGIKLRPDWKEIQLKVMEYALKYKFAEGTTWHKELMKHPEPIVETNNWHDNFWGSCVCARCGNKGLNHLGKLIEQLKG